MATRRIAAGRVHLALHALQERPGPALLLLHTLHGSSAEWGRDFSVWPGPVFALDFCGHGESDWLRGGGYYPEVFAADADQALSEIGTSHLVGAGIGGYVALLLAGARPGDVPGALLLPGPGFAGGGAEPDFDAIASRSGAVLDSFMGPGTRGNGPDPMVRMADGDARPIDYVRSFASEARRLLLARGEAPVPDWAQALLDLPKVSEIDPSGSGVALAARHFQAASLSLDPTQG